MQKERAVNGLGSCQSRQEGNSEQAESLKTLNAAFTTRARLENSRKNDLAKRLLSCTDKQGPRQGSGTPEIQLSPGRWRRGKVRAGLRTHLGLTLEHSGGEQDGAP